MKKFTILTAGSLLFLTSCTVNTNPETTKKYTVKFVNDEGKLLQQDLVEEGTYPVYEGDIPESQKTPEAEHQYVFNDWDKEITAVTEDTTYTATYDYVFEFGQYPQTLVTDEELITQLNMAIQEKRRDEDTYYVELNGVNYYQFEAKSSYTADDGTMIQKGDVNFYKVEPIQWKILEENEDQSFYTTYKLLAPHVFNDYEDETTNDPTYHNTYKQSSLHQWLNDTEEPALPEDIPDVQESEHGFLVSTNTYAVKRGEVKFTIYCSDESHTISNLKLNNGSTVLSQIDSELQMKNGHLDVTFDNVNFEGKTEDATITFNYDEDTDLQTISKITIDTTKETDPDIIYRLGGFAWRAFNDSQWNEITQSTVDNSLKSTLDDKNRFADDTECEAKIFELSRKNLHGYDDEAPLENPSIFEPTDGVSLSRLAVTTDFARADGAANSSYRSDKKYWGEFWTRSPCEVEWDEEDSNWAYASMLDGAIDKFDVYLDEFCARPSFKIIK